MELYCRFPLAAVRVGFPGMRSALYRQRNLGLPTIPNRLEEFCNILHSEEWGHLNCCLAEEGHSQFFQTTIGGNEEDWTAGVYPSRRLAGCSPGEHLPSHLHIDATFKTVPRNLGATQLLNIHTERDGHLFPIDFVLMTRKTEAAYRRVFGWIRQNIPNLTTTTILCDFEPAMRAAAQATWAPQLLLGCWCHLAVSVCRFSLTERVTCPDDFYCCGVDQCCKLTFENQSNSSKDSFDDWLTGFCVRAVIVTGFMVMLYITGVSIKIVRNHYFGKCCPEISNLPRYKPLEKNSIASNLDNISTLIGTPFYQVNTDQVGVLRGGIAAVPV
ncbi:uncharacterized protein LOC128985771 [Macrosteles quadrilineatus]|uniref:uncharacterized protein LOC128985771 n=1 Tax=Macrosteles quadrilineatus TaxID=74068 RepID=UPI0023E1336C|nr:uncharacterized protein LOC128985771 [Macrosteles quadrilineatus]